MELMNKVLIILIMVTLVVGTMGSLRQQKLIRFIAYSAIVNSGLLILFFVGNNIEELISYSVYYLINYIIGLTVLISITMGMRRNITGENIEILTELRNIWVNNKVIGAILVVVLIYLAGLPPFTNFISKLILILPYIVEGRMYIAMIILFLTVGVMIYYLNIVKIILIDKKTYNGIGGKNMIENYKMVNGGAIISLGVMWIVFSQLFLDEVINIIKIIVAVSQ
jgi:NADH-quinone oxidoreductase subunit N